MEAVRKDTADMTEQEWKELDAFMQEWIKETRAKQIKKRNEEYKKLSDSWEKANDVLFGKAKH